MEPNKEYNKKSKKYYIDMITEKFAYDLFLNEKYCTESNNSVEVIWNTCVNSGWIISDKEKEVIMKRVV